MQWYSSDKCLHTTKFTNIQRYLNIQVMVTSIMLLPMEKLYEGGGQPLASALRIKRKWWLKFPVLDDRKYMLHPLHHKFKYIRDISTYIQDILQSSCFPWNKCKKRRHQPLTSALGGSQWNDSLNSLFLTEQSICWTDLILPMLQQRHENWGKETKGAYDTTESFSGRNPVIY